MSFRRHVGTLHLAAEVALANVAPRPRPFKLPFIVAYRCNLRCAMFEIWRRLPA